MSETESTKYCKTCKENTPHTCSGTGRKGWCEMCGTTYDNTKEAGHDMKDKRQHLSTAEVERRRIPVRDWPTNTGDIFHGFAKCECGQASSGYSTGWKLYRVCKCGRNIGPANWTWHTPKDWPTNK